MDREALKIFTRQPVNNDMVNYLVSTTNSIIQIKHKPNYETYNGCKVSPYKTSLLKFIKNLIKYSNVQTPTLMATLIYLNKLRNLLPANAIGMETTRHRIFLASLIISAKNLNDSSPLNKHWTKYTDGLLTIEEVNMAERELISLLKWNVNITEEDLVIALQPFLLPIKSKLAKKLSLENSQKVNYYRQSAAYNTYGASNSSISSYNSSHSDLMPPYASRSSSTSSINSVSSPLSLSSSSSIYSHSSSNYSGEYRPPLINKGQNYINSNYAGHNKYSVV